MYKSMSNLSNEVRKAPLIRLKKKFRNILLEFNRKKRTRDLDNFNSDTLQRDSERQFRNESKKNDKDDFKFLDKDIELGRKLPRKFKDEIKAKFDVVFDNNIARQKEAFSAQREEGGQHRHSKTVKEAQAADKIGGEEAMNEFNDYSK